MTLDSTCWDGGMLKVTGFTEDSTCGTPKVSEGGGGGGGGSVIVMGGGVEDLPI
jgi:hypothetical protein